jgi:hypothetical protein
MIRTIRTTRITHPKSLAVLLLTASIITVTGCRTTVVQPVDQPAAQPAPQPDHHDADHHDDDHHQPPPPQPDHRNDH